MEMLRFRLINGENKNRVLKKTVLAIIIFINVYPFVIKGMPFSLARICQILGLLLVVYQFYVKRKFSIEKNIFEVVIAYLIISFISLLVSLRGGYLEYEFFKETFTPLMYIFSVYFIYFMFKVFAEKFTFYNVIDFILLSSLIQIVISLVMFFNYDVYITIMSFLDLDKDLSERINLVEYRLMGVGNSVWMAGFNYGLNLLMLILLPYVSKSSCFVKNKYLYAVTIIMVLIAGILSARTFFVSILLGILMYVCLENFHLLKIFKKAFKFVFIGFALFLLIINVFDFEITTRFELIFNWAFEFVINLFNTGNFETSSTNHMFKDMYILPDNIYTWFFGDGVFISKYGGYYKGTDVGYIRLLFYFGIIGFLIYYSIVVFVFYKVITLSRNRHVKIFLYFIMLKLFILNFKGLINADFYLMLFLLLSVVENQSKDKYNRINQSFEAKRVLWKS